MIKEYPIVIEPARLPDGFTAEDERETRSRLLERCEFLNSINYFDKLSEEKRESFIAKWFYEFAYKVVREREER